MHHIPPMTAKTSLSLLKTLVYWAWNLELAEFLVLSLQWPADAIVAKRPITQIWRQAVLMLIIVDCIKMFTTTESYAIRHRSPIYHSELACLEDIESIFFGIWNLILKLYPVRSPSSISHAKSMGRNFLRAPTDTLHFSIQFGPDGG